MLWLQPGKQEQLFLYEFVNFRPESRILSWIVDEFSSHIFFKVDKVYYTSGYNTTENTQPFLKFWGFPSEFYQNGVTLAHPSSSYYTQFVILYIFSIWVEQVFTTYHNIVYITITTYCDDLITFACDNRSITV